MVLRDYQLKSIREIEDAWCECRSVFLQMPTGTGKTIVFLDIAKKFIEQQKPVLIIAHKEEIIQQIVERLRKYEVEPGIIKAGYFEHRERPIQVASIQTLSRRDHPPADLIIIDEAHHFRTSSANRSKKLFELTKNSR